MAKNDRKNSMWFRGSKKWTFFSFSSEKSKVINNTKKL